MDSVGHGKPNIAISRIKTLSRPSVRMPNNLLNRMASISQSIVSDSMQPLGLQPAAFLCPWNFPGKDTGVGSYFLFQRDLPYPGMEPEFLASPTLQADSLPLCHLVKFINTK